jgi:7,8-dihydro-6-hydroxymethylpterin-pyrophosphokinase
MLHFKNIKNIEHMLKQKRGEGGGQRRLDLDLGIHHDE